MSAKNNSSTSDSLNSALFDAAFSPQKLLCETEADAIKLRYSLYGRRRRLVKHYSWMQHLRFTIQDLTLRVTYQPPLLFTQLPVERTDGF